MDGWSPNKFARGGSPVVEEMEEGGDQSGWDGEEKTSGERHLSQNQETDKIRMTRNSEFEGIRTRTVLPTSETKGK